MERDVDAIVAGHICIDVIPSFPDTGAGVEEIFAPGKLTNVGPLVAATGGTVSNTGTALIRLGIRTRLMGKVGTDFFGRGVLELLGRYDAQDGMVVVDGESSSYSFVLAPPGVDRIFLHHPGANDTFGPEDVDYEMVARSRLFHFGYPPIMKKMFAEDGADLAEMFRRVKATGATASLDMALPDPASEAGQANWPKILAKTLPLVDVFLPSVEEILFMLDRKRFDELRDPAGDGDILERIPPEEVAALAKRLLDLGVKVAVVKCGHKGLCCATAGAGRLADMGAARPSDPDGWADRLLWQETFHVENFVSAAGAGDNTIAGFLAGLLYGHSAEMSLRCGCVVGAQNVAVPDAGSGVKSWRETQEMAAAGLPRNELVMDPAHWRFDPDNLLWGGARGAEG